MTVFLSLIKDHVAMVQITLFLTVIVSIWLAELRLSMRTVKDKWTHTSINLLFISTALPIQLLLSLIVIFISGWVGLHHWGILHVLPFSGSIIIKYLIGFFLLDFFEYLYHVTMHKVGKLWNFHLIHHSDQQIDVSTTVREHPCETFIRVCFQIFWVFLSGASIGLLLLRQSIQTIANLTSHSSCLLPMKLERIVRLLFITPGLHHIHHHYELPYTDSNYGDVFSIWDRVFGTYREMKSEEIQFGVDAYHHRSTTRFLDLIQYPFIKKEQKQLLISENTVRKECLSHDSLDVSVIDSVTDKVISTIPLGGKPETGVSDGRGRIYVNIEDKNQVVCFDAIFTNKTF